jgi:fused signal recognition particle receptor
LLRALFGRGPTHGAGLDQGLERSRRSLLDQLTGPFRPVDITEETWELLEERLIQSDVGSATAQSLVRELKRQAGRRGIRRADELPRVLATLMVAQLEAAEDAGTAPPIPNGRPRVVLVVGVNGSGKTTSIAKLAHRYREAGQRVVLVAGDTFRAAAIEQLEVWGARCGVSVIGGQQGGDPGAAVFDALGSSVARNADVVIVDTAGRLHTQANLMAELQKVRSIVSRQVPGAPHDTLLVMDATTGQNGLSQARAFTESVGVTGLVLAKLDSSSKGGVAFAIARDLGLPIAFVGTGEGLDDLAPFDATQYVTGLLGLRCPDPSPDM